MIGRTSSCVLGICLCLASAGAGATTYFDRPLEQRIARAERVVLARVISTRVEREDGVRPRLTTVVQLEVEETLKGTPAKSLILRQLGGAADGWSAEIPGAPRFEQNERAVFLLRCRATAEEVPSCTLVGLRDAKLPVVTGAGSVEVLVPSVSSDSMERMSLDELRKKATGAGR